MTDKLSTAPLDPNTTRRLREWTVRSGRGKAKVLARTPFTACVKVVKAGGLRTFGWIIQVDAKGIERCYCGTKQVFRAAGKAWPKNFPKWPV